jgi:hypothetical protein
VNHKLLIVIVVTVLCLSIGTILAWKSGLISFYSYRIK